MHHVLKILSGHLSGVEYTLSGDETLFHVGPHQDLVDGTAARLLGQADNAYYLPADVAPASFAIRRSGEGDAAALELGERDGSQSAWHWAALPVQQPYSVAGVHVAVRHAGESWSHAVSAFSPPPAVAATVIEAEAPGRAVAPPRRNVAAIAGVVTVALVAIGAGWFHWHYLPETRIRGLASILRDAPSDYDIVAGKRDSLYVFADSPADKAWAERASRRQQRRTDVHLVRQEQARRLEQHLIDAGLDLVVVRLEQPARPEVVLQGRQTASSREQVQHALAGHIPWQHQLVVTAVSDQQLVAEARQALSVRGISSRVEPHGTRANVTNDTFLDDVALSDMTAAAAAFHARWGTRRITITPRLWDDLLQGRSYRYSPGQLLSVGSGRWSYAGTAGSAATAAP